MAQQAGSNPTPREIVKILDKILDDESTGAYVYFIPVATGVKLGMSDPDCIVPTIVAVCRQVLKRMLDGKDRNEIRAYLTGTIGFDDRFAAMAIGQTLDCAAVASRIHKKETTRGEAVAELLQAKNAEIRTIHAMLDMIDGVLADGHGKYSASQLDGLIDDISPLTGYYKYIKLAAMTAWPLLWFGFQFRWWTSLLAAIAFYFVTSILLVFIDVKLERK